MRKHHITKMAEVPSEGVKQTPAETLANHIQCAICLETYRDPKALACLHTYCKECVQRLVLQQCRDQQVECPQCRSLVPVPGNDANSLPTVFFINTLIEFYDTLKKAESNEIACQNCSGSKAAAFCQDCEMFICSECVNAHKRMKVFSGHNPLSLSEMKQGSLVHLPAKKLPAFTCQKQGHGGELLKLYCFTCQQLICRDCTLIDHASHKFDFVNSVAVAFKEEVRASLAPLKETCSRVSEAVDKVEGAKTQIETQEASIVSIVTNLFDNFHAILEEHKQSLLHQTKESAQEKLGALSQQHESLQLAQATLESLVSFTEKMAENASDEEIVLKKQQLSSRIQQLKKKYKQIRLDPVQVADVSVVVPTVESFHNFCKKNGVHFSVSLVDPSKCTAQGPGIKGANTNQEAKLTVHLVDKQGRTCFYFPQSSELLIAAELKTVASGSLTPVRVERKDPSSFELSYIPTTRGRHQLSVRVSDVEIGPFQVFVHHPPTQLGTPVRIINGLESADRIAVDSHGRLYVTDFFSGQFTILDRNAKRIQTSRGDYRTGIAVDEEGAVLVASRNSVQKFSKDGRCVKTVAGFQDPCGLRIHNKLLYVCDCGNACIRVYDLNLKFVMSFGSRGDAPGQFELPRDIDFDSKGNGYISDIGRNEIDVFTNNGQYLRCLLRRNQRIMDARGICVYGDYVYVAPFGGQRISVFHTSGAFVTSFGGQLGGPMGMTVDQDGFLYVCDFGNSRVVVF